MKLILANTLKFKKIQIDDSKVLNLFNSYGKSNC